MILAGGLASDFTLDAYIFPQASALSRPIATLLGITALWGLGGVSRGLDE